MHTIVVGLNYKSAPVEIVSTCNRTEIYAVVDQLHTGRHFVKQFLAKWFDLPVETFSSYLTIREEMRQSNIYLK